MSHTMLEFFRSMFKKMACMHEWETVRVMNKYEFATSKLPFRITTLYCCKKCGKFKKVNVS